MTFWVISWTRYRHDEGWYLYNDLYLQQWKFRCGTVTEPSQMARTLITPVVEN